MASTTGTVRPVLRLVWPVLLEQMLGLSVGFTDKWLAGNLLEGAEYLAAVGLVAYCLGFLPGLFAVPAVAATALVSRSVGAGDLPGARRAATQAMLVAAALTAAVLGVVAVCGDSFVRALGLPSGSTALATRYGACGRRGRIGGPIRSGSAASCTSAFPPAWMPWPTPLATWLFCRS